MFERGQWVTFVRGFGGDGQPIARVERGERGVVCYPLPRYPDRFVVALERSLERSDEDEAAEFAMAFEDEIDAIMAPGNLSELERRSVEALADVAESNR